MKKLIVLSLISLCFALNGFAKDDSMSIIYVDVLKVFSEYNKTEDYDKALEAKKEEKDKELEKQKGDIEKLRNELKMLSDKDKKDKESELEKKILDAKGIILDVQKERDERVKDIFEDITKVINDYAKSNKISLVLTKGAIAFGDPSLDKTSEIIKLLNSKYKKK